MNVAVYVFAATPLPTGTTAVVTSALAAAYGPHDSATRRASGARSDAAPPFTSGSVATKVTAAVSPCRATGPSSGLDVDTSRTEVITGGLRSTYTRSSAGHAETSNLTRHVVPTFPRQSVEVTSESFQFTDAPSTNPEPSAAVASAGTTRVTVTLPFATAESLAPTTTATSEPSSAAATPATDADATSSAVDACRVSVNAWLGPATRSSNALSEEVTHEYPTL